jgi:hypothetical protein
MKQTKTALQKLGKRQLETLRSYAAGNGTFANGGWLHGSESSSISVNEARRRSGFLEQPGPEEERLPSRTLQYRLTQVALECLDHERRMIEKRKAARTVAVENNAEREALNKSARLAVAKHLRIAGSTFPRGLPMEFEILELIRSSADWIEAQMLIEGMLAAEGRKGLAQ